MKILGIVFAALIGTAATGQDFPMTIEHKFGATLIEEPPVRIASVDFAGADDLLALGVQPVAIRYWYGDYDQAVWPWADPFLTTTPEILRDNLNFEQIAATEPDLIIALWSGIDANEYAQLSLIAPVIAVPRGVGDYAMAWDARALLTVRIIGKSDEAEAQVRAIQNRLANVAADHPDWQGLTAAVGFVTPDGPGAYTAADIRPQLLNSLGFVNPPAIDGMAEEGAFTVSFSEEAIDPIDGDIVVWVDAAGAFNPVLDLAGRPFLSAVQDGREVFMCRDSRGVQPRIPAVPAAHNRSVGAHVRGRARR